MKKLLCAAALTAMASPAFANESVTGVKVFDHTRTVIKETPVTELDCREVKKPVYSNFKTFENNAGEGALGGMILGGIIGKAIGGDDRGAAAGAILGGVIGADKAGNKSSKEIIGYELVEVCEKVVIYEREPVEVYSHSTIRFYLNGQRHVVKFQR